MNDKRTEHSRNDKKNPNRSEQVKKRIPMQTNSTVNAPREYMEEGFYHRWCADNDKGKLSRYLQAGYEYVKDENGDRIKREGKDPVFLMRLPEKDREEDLAAKRARIIEVNKKVQQENAPKTDGGVPEYIPKENGNDVVFREDI